MKSDRTRNPGAPRVQTGRSAEGWLFVVALVARLAAVAALGLDERAGPLDYEHGAIARELLAGRGFSIEYLGVYGGTSQQAPWTPVVTAGAYWAAGAGTAEARMLLSCVQAWAGALAVVFVVRLARHVAPEQAAVPWAAGLMAALFPPHVYAVTHVQAAPWAMLLTVAIWERAIAGGAGAGSWTRAVVLGVLLAGAALVDPILVLAAPFAAAAAIRRANENWLRQGWSTFERWRLGTRRVLLASLVAGVILAPWLVRNRLVHGEWVFVKSTFGYAFWQGNNGASHGTDKIPKPEASLLAGRHDGSLAGMNQALWAARHETLYIDDVVLRPRGYERFHGLSEPARSRVLEAEARVFIAEHPQRYAQLCVRRLAYWLFWDGTNPKALHPLYQASSLAWLVTTLAGAGIVLGDRRKRTAGAVLLVLWAGAMTGFHALTIAGARFRMPVEIPLVALGAAAVGPAAANVGRRIGEAMRRLAARGVLRGAELARRLLGWASAQNGAGVVFSEVVRPTRREGPRGRLQGPHFPLGVVDRAVGVERTEEELLVEGVDRDEVEAPTGPRRRPR